MELLCLLNPLVGQRHFGQWLLHLTSNYIRYLEILQQEFPFCGMDCFGTVCVMLGLLACPLCGSRHAKNWHGHVSQHCWHGSL